MRKIMLSLGIVLITALTLQAQGPKGEERNPEEIAKRQATKMKKDLVLTDEQYDKVYEIVLNRTGKMKAMRMDTQQEKSAKREEMKAMNEKTNADLKGILTEEQMAKHLKIQQEHKQSRKDKRGPKGEGAPPPRPADGQ